MGLVGIALGLTVAVLWGIADSIATLATRRLQPLLTTFISQSAGLIAIMAFALLTSWFWLAITFPQPALARGVLLAFCTGIFATGGYLIFYHALKIGPVALVSPISSTSAAVTLVLALLLLQESMTFLQVIAIALLLLGVIVASANFLEVRTLLKNSDNALLSRGVMWAIVAALAFGAMDFGIGATARTVGWFLSVLWARSFSLFFLTLILCLRVYRDRPKTIEKGNWSGKEHNKRIQIPRSFPLSVTGAMLAIVAGLMEISAVMIFSIDTQIAMTGVTAAIASNYSLVVIAFGYLVFRERLVLHQFFGIGLVICGLFVLAFSPI